MTSPPVPASEEARLEALHSYRVLDTAPEADFDDLARLAAEVCAAPIALVSLIDERRLWVKAKYGIELTEMPREQAFCVHALQVPELLEIRDAARDPRVAALPLVAGGSGLRFYAGVPLRTAAGDTLGTLCVFDYLPRALDAQQRRALRVLARQVMQQLELRRQLREQARTEERLQQSSTLLAIASDSARLGGWQLDLASMRTSWSDAVRRIYEVAPDYQPEIDHVLQFYVAEDRARVVSAVDACIASGQSFDIEAQIITARGRRIWVRAIGRAQRDADGRIRLIQGAIQDIDERKSGEMQLAQLDRRLQSTMESISDALLTLDHDWRVVYMNPRAEQLLQRRREDLLGTVVWDHFDPARQTRSHNEYQRAATTRETVAFVEYFEPLNTWFDVTAYPTRDGLAVYFRDINDRVMREHQLQQLGVALEERNQLLAMMVQGAPLRQIMLRLVHLAEQQIPGVACTVSYVDSELRVRSLAAPNMPPTFIAAIEGAKIDLDDGNGGIAAYAGGASIAEDIATNDFWKPFSSLALAHGLRACWSHPIIASGGRLLGIFAMYFRERRTPRDDELALLASAHNLAAIAIEGSEMRSSLEQSAAQYRYLFESNPNPMWVFDVETLRFLAVNDAAIAHYGYTRDEFMQMTLRDVLAPHYLERFDQQGVPHIQTLGDDSFSQVGHRRKSGDTILVDISSFRIEFSACPARLVVIRDVTAIEHAQKNLAERDRQLGVLLESTSEGIYGIDNRGFIAFANRACASLLGYDSPDELVGLPAHKTLHHSPQEQGECDGSICPIHRAMSTGERNHADDQCFWHRDGFPVPVEYWYYPMQRDGLPDGAIVTFFDITDRHAQREALAWQATHDTLTGLPNRAMLQSELQRAILESDSVDSDAVDNEASDSKVSDRGFALLLIDLDQFKEINDTLGHPAGDQLLRTLGPRLTACIGAGETVVRLGGDEFAVLLRPGLLRAQVAERALLLLQAIEEPVEVEGTRVQVGASIGAAFYPDDGGNAEELLRCADVAMYGAKHNHQRYAAYESLFDDNRPERLTLMSDLRTAIAAQQLSLYYQPKIDLASGDVAGFEALMRWHHPQRGLISPGEFVPWIERSDLIHPFTAWVLEAAIAQCRQWCDAGFRACVSVNISTGNLLDTALPARIEALLQRYQLPASQLELEITESSIMANPPRSLEVVGALRQLGLRVSIDDFGTGYSSLAYLQQLPVNCVKIDGSFVRGLLVDDSARLIVSAIIDLSHKLGLEVVAEGVEDGAIMAVLRQFGCDQVQGYHIARPQPAPQALAWLREHRVGHALSE